MDDANGPIQRPAEAASGSPGDPNDPGARPAAAFHRQSATNKVTSHETLAFSGKSKNSIPNDHGQIGRSPGVPNWRNFGLDPCILNLARFRVFLFSSLLLATLALGCGGASDKPDAPESEAAAPAANEAGAAASRQTTPPEAESRPKVVFQTSAGSFTVALHRDKVQRTVDNFLRYVDTRFYDGTLFHEVIALCRRRRWLYRRPERPGADRKTGLGIDPQRIGDGFEQCAGDDRHGSGTRPGRQRSMPVLYKP